jgi:uncharacterized OB-fold protein
MPNPYLDDDEPGSWEAEASDGEFADIEDDSVATANCPNCGEEVYVDVDQCPYCGDYITPTTKNKSSSGWQVMAWIVMLVVILLAILGWRWF